MTADLLSAEFSIPWKALTLNGEVYTGQGLGAEFLHRNGAFNLAGEPIRTQGGFLQLGLQAASAVRLHFGYGIDDPDDDDLVGRRILPEEHVPFRQRDLCLHAGTLGHSGRHPGGDDLE